MLRQTRRLRDGTHGEGLLGREGVQGALEAGRDLGQDESALAAQALRASVDERDDRRRDDLFFLVILNQPHDQTIQPPARLDVVQARDDQLELLVEVLVLVLHHALVRGDLAARNTLHDEVCSGLGLALAHITHAEQKLAV